MDSRMKALIAIGASVTANCQPCLSYHIGKAREAGADEKEVAIAIEVAKAVRTGAGNNMDKFAGSTLGKAASASPSDGCGCGCQ
jgi:AhpD family alkylhydroperoxidase